jgi:hypothetical protein
MKLIYASIIAAAALAPSLSYANDTLIPYMNPDGPQPREIHCQIADHGTVYHNGVCYFQAGSDGSFIVTTGNAKYSAAVGPINGDFAQAMWTEEAFASHMHGQLHDVKRSVDDPACWENDELSICAW